MATQPTAFYLTDDGRINEDNKRRLEEIAFRMYGNGVIYLSLQENTDQNLQGMIHLYDQQRIQYKDLNGYA